MKPSKNSILAAFTVVFTLIIAASSVMFVPIASAAKTPVAANVAVNPKVSGLGHPITVSAFITPMPETFRNHYTEVYIIFTKPDGTTVTEGPLTTYPEGTLYLTYTPDKLGSWSVKLTWAGDDTHEGAESESFAFTVQQEPLPTTPVVPLPSGYWARPINAENREWYQISGDWYYSGKVMNYNASGGSFNPYSKAPETAHVLWKHQPYIGGLVGGDYGDKFYSVLYLPSELTVILAGRVYYPLHDGIHCLDLRTGQELWDTPTPIEGTSAGGTSMSYAANLWGCIEETAYTNRDRTYGNNTYVQPMKNPILWTTGRLATTSVITKYDASTGVKLLSLTAPANYTFVTTYFDSGAECAYTQASVKYANGTTGNRMIKWDTMGTVRTFSQRIIWDEPTPTDWFTFRGIWGNALVSLNDLGNTPAKASAIDAETGKLLWTNTAMGNTVFNMFGSIAYGKIFWPDSLNRNIHAFDLKTGTEVWASEPREYPFGGFTAYNMGAAYGKVYVESYDGYLYAYDAETGKTVWKFYSGDSAETPYNTWPFWSGIAIADGKVYAGTSEHSPTAPFMRGCRQYCLDANTGKEIWSMSFANGGGKAIADGSLVASNEYDSTMYCFDKGQTATTVTASPKVTAKGSTVLLEGTITDKSPAQPGTPAIADEYMSSWMEYLHMQKAKPANAAGVQIKLTATDPNGNTQNIGTVTSTEKGNFAFAWTPPVPGVYTVTATFDGTKSYYGSDAETAFVVSEATSPSASPSEAPPPQKGPNVEMTILLPAAVAIIIVVAIAAVILRRRK
ncbi:MAG: PQQ-binding-like beta-propeller repeat protein [Candidatus Bathyarchaeia archaeon]